MNHIVQKNKLGERHRERERKLPMSGIREGA